MFEREFLVDEFYKIGVLKFGSFTLKSGQISPFYLDLRLSISFPYLLRSIAAAIEKRVESCEFDLVCGVPYTALPFATAVSLSTNIPMLLKRKEKKEYGTGKMIEGFFQKGQKCLVVEDVITTGQSIFETIGALEAEGLVVKDIVVIVDRQQGGSKRLADSGYCLHSLFTITEMVELLEKRKMDAKYADQVFSIRQFIEQ